MTPATRNEHDLLGDRVVPADAYWGVHTLRAAENFPITGQAVATAPDLVNALAAIKPAAALANHDLGLRWLPRGTDLGALDEADIQVPRLPFSGRGLPVRALAETSKSASLEALHFAVESPVKRTEDLTPWAN